MKYLFLLLFLPTCLHSAEYAVPSDRLPATGTWQAAGVPGGITVRSTIHDTITATGLDQTAEIQTALSTCPSGEVVLCAAGTFRLDSSVTVGSMQTLRGSVDGNGDPTTIFDARGTTGVFVGNYSAEMNWPTGGANLVVASLTKGATTIQVDDASEFYAGHLVLIDLGENPDFPLINSYNGARGRSQIARVVSRNTAASPDTITIEAPGLHGDYTGHATAKIWTNQGQHRTGAGLENILVSGSNNPYIENVDAGLKAAIVPAGCYASWVLNCHTEDTVNYGLAMQGYPGVLQTEIRHCRLTGALVVANSTSGMLIGGASSVLIIDNIFEEWSFSFLPEAGNSGLVFADNLFVNVGAGTTNTNVNHSPAPQFTLLEANVGAVTQSDGLNGGSLFDMNFRNWWMGKSLGETGDFYSIIVNRYSRFYNAVGNQYGQTGVLAAPPSGFGNPNMGNGESSNPASRRATASTLTTRTNATSGVITAPASHGVTTGATIDLIWSEVSGPYNVAKVRRDVTVGTVSGTSIPFSGGEGADLPSEVEIVYVPTTNSALWDNDPDFDTVTQKERIWTGSLTTRTDDKSGVFTLDSGATELNAAMVDAYNAQRGFKPFPAHADSPNASQVNIISVVGNAVTFNNCTWTTLPPQGSALTMVPSNFGLQGLDLDVLLTTLQKANYHGKASGSGIPAVESIGSDTLPESLFRSGTPAHYVGLTYPPINPFAPVDNSYEIIPAGYRYVNGFDPGGGGAATVSGNAAAGSVRIGQ